MQRGHRTNCRHQILVLLREKKIHRYHRRDIYRFHDLLDTAEGFLAEVPSERR